MREYCKSLQDRLAENGSAILAKDEAAEAHCVECNDCFSFLEALPKLDALLQELPESDAPQAVVDALLAKVSSMPVKRSIAVAENLHGTQRETFELRSVRKALRSFSPPAWILNSQVPVRHLVLGLFSLLLFLSYSFKDLMRVGGRRSVPLSSEQKGMRAEEQYGDLIQAFKNDIEQSKREQAQLRDEVLRKDKASHGRTEKSNKIFEGIVDKFENLDSEVDTLAAALKQNSGAAPAKSPQQLGEKVGQLEAGKVQAPILAMKNAPVEAERKAKEVAAKSDEGESLGFDTPNLPEPPPKKVLLDRPSLKDQVAVNAPQETNSTTSNEKRLRVSAINPGDAVEVELLTGVNAPVDGTPYPVVFKLTGPITGPDGKALEYSEARLVAAAQGSEADGRALYRLSSLSVRKPNGTRETVKVDGWIVGKDGIRGTPGKVVDKLGRFLAETAAVNKEDQRLALQDNEDTNDFSAVSQKLGQTLLSRYEKLIPVVEVGSGEGAVAIFSQSSSAPHASEPMITSSGVTSGDSPAEKFFRISHALSGVSFKDPQGYWANTYVPGDPSFRRLQTVLLQEHPSFLRTPKGEVLSLHQTASQGSQPFDSPKDSALALYLNSEKTSVQGPSRFTVQVGIKGSAESKGRRPSMNLALVLDLRGETPQTEIQNMIREVLFAFNRAKDLGDHFSVFVAGRDKTLLLDPNTFTHGQLTVALQDLFQKPSTGDANASLLEILERAGSQVGENDDPTAPLGSSSIVLLTSHALSGELPELERFAHKSAVSGVPLSVFGLGSGLDTQELDRLALSGQGNRRMLSSANEAKTLADKEIEAVSTTVARAVRLNIRLAPGVKLVDVLGSYKFDSAQAERVREAEKSIDLRISKSMGIAADRGADDEGIQIVIPSYHAGDAHVVLLDVVASGPGPVAEVSARYKDLVHLRNGVSQASLTLPQMETRPGVLELNVIKNRLAFELSKVLEQAAREVDQGQSLGAAAKLEEFREVLLGAPKLSSGLSGDPEMLKDAEMLSQYIGLLKSSVPQDETSRSYLRNSLAFAGRLKTHPLVIDKDTTT